MSLEERTAQLRSLIRLLSDASEVVIEQWKLQDNRSLGMQQSDDTFPTAELFEARRRIIGACGMCVDLVQEPSSRLTDVACSYLTARALHIAAQARVADVLASADTQDGVSALEISQKVGINAQKLTRVLRTLCTNHIFAEVRDGHFTNNHTSADLVGNEYLRCWILMHALQPYTASDKLLPLLFDPRKTDSTDPRMSAWQDATGTDLTPWEFLEQKIQMPDGTLQYRPEHEIWSLAMVGGGRAYSPAIYYDYPWESLGNGTVVDVGGGAGGTSLDLARRFSELQFIVQDLGPTIKQARLVWRREYPEAIAQGRVHLAVHDFFTEQPVKGADVYFMRYILHDWPDDECVKILTNLHDAMGSHSVILIADEVIHTTVGSSMLKSAPYPLPANYGVAHQFTNMHDLVMMSVHNGMERTPEMLNELAMRAGLTVTKIWECRGINAVTEMRRDDIKHLL